MDSHPSYLVGNSRNCIDIRIVFTSFKVKNYISLKCHTPLPLLANVVDKFKCLRDANNIYIGKTIRHLATRVKEHGTLRSPSAVSNYLLSCETCKLNFSCDSFSIIDSGKNDFGVTIKEALHIKFKKPTINRQLYSQGSSFVTSLATEVMFLVALVSLSVCLFVCGHYSKSYERIVMKFYGRVLSSTRKN